MQYPKDPETVKRYPNNIGWWIKKQGYTQEEVADTIGIARRTLSNYISGRRVTPRHYLEKIAKTIGCDIEELTVQSVHDTSRLPPEIPEVQQKDGPISHRESDDMDRRQTLRVLGSAGVSLIAGIPALAHLEEIEKRFARRTARLHSWLLESLEEGTRSRWQLYYTSRNSLTEEGLLRQITRLEQLADEGGQEEARVYSVLIQNYQLAGSLARDNFHYTRAKQYFIGAQQLAQDIQSPDLAVTAIARHGLVLMRRAGIAEVDEGYQKRIAEALVLYQSAAEMASRTEGHVKAYILSGLAEALARNGQRDACYRALDEAERLLHCGLIVSPEEDIAQVRLTLQSLEDSRGECYVLLGEPLKGLDYLQAAQKRLDPAISRNLCRVLMQQAEAYLAAGYPDQSVQYAIQGLQIARTLESTSNINWSREIHTKLLRSKWKGEPVVGELEAALAG
jgi:transcriptional regulator with XRE-family HTH domain